MVHWIPMQHLYQYPTTSTATTSTRRPYRLHVFNFFKESYRCLDIRPEGLHEDIFESEIISSHCADLLSVRPEYHHDNQENTSTPIYIGSNFHYSCGLELKNMRYVNENGHRRVTLEFEKGYMNKFDSVDPHSSTLFSNGNISRLRTQEQNEVTRVFPNWIWIYLPYTHQDDIDIDFIAREENKLRLNHCNSDGSGFIDKEIIEVDGTSIIILQHGGSGCQDTSGQADEHPPTSTSTHSSSSSSSTKKKNEANRAYVVAGGHQMKGVVLKIALISIDLTEGPDLEICW